jgi:cell wall-associated NlpC family hydrolase
VYLIIKITTVLSLAFLTALSPKRFEEETKEVRVNKDSLVNFSKAQLGKNYNYANCTPQTGFDCSGFVYYIFTHFKVDVPRSSSEYSGFGKTVPVDSCKTGDVIVFTGTDASKRSPGHVGIVLTGGENLSFIHSSSDKRTPGVKISNFKDSPNYKKRFLKIVRVCKVI